MSFVRSLLRETFGSPLPLLVTRTGVIGTQTALRRRIARIIRQTFQKVILPRLAWTSLMQAVCRESGTTVKLYLQEQILSSQVFGSRSGPAVNTAVATGRNSGALATILGGVAPGIASGFGNLLSPFMSSIRK